MFDFNTIRQSWHVADTQPLFLERLYGVVLIYVLIHRSLLAHGVLCIKSDTDIDKYIF